MIEDQFDVAAQDRRAEAAKRARQVPAYVYDRDAVIAAAGQDSIDAFGAEAGLMTRNQATDAVREAEIAAALAKVEGEVPESPKVEQEPELTQEPAAAPPGPAASARPDPGTDG